MGASAVITAKDTNTVTVAPAVRTTPSTKVVTSRIKTGASSTGANLRGQQGEEDNSECFKKCVHILITRQAAQSFKKRGRRMK